MRETKRFKGGIYELERRRLSYQEAQRYAKGLRKEGYRCIVTPMVRGSKNKDNYMLWSKRAKPFRRY